MPYNYTINYHIWYNLPTNIRTRIVGGQWRHKITIYGNGLSVYYIQIWQIRDVTNRLLFTRGYYFPKNDRLSTEDILREGTQHVVNILAPENHNFSFIEFYTFSASFWYQIYLGGGLCCLNEVKFSLTKQKTIMIWPCNNYLLACLMVILAEN